MQNICATVHFIKGVQSLYAAVHKKKIYLCINSPIKNLCSCPLKCFQYYFFSVVIAFLNCIIEKCEKYVSLIYWTHVVMYALNC